MRDRPAQAPAGKSPPQGGERRSSGPMLDELQDMFLQSLSKSLRKALNEVHDDFAERALDEQSRERRQMMSDVLAVLRAHRTAIEARFDRVCADLWASKLRGNEPSRTSSADIKMSALSLLDDTVLLDQMAVDKVAERSRRRLDNDLVVGIRARLGTILGRDWFGESDYPAAPDMVYEAVRAAVAEAAGPALVTGLLDAIEQKLTSELAGIYGKANEMMVSRGVLPEIRYRVERGANGKERVSPMPPEPAPDEAAQDPRQAMMPGARAGSFTADIPPAGMQPRGPGPMGAPIGAGSQSSADAGFGWDPQAQSPGPLAAARLLPPEEMADLVSQLDQKILSAQASAARYLSDPTRFADLPPDAMPTPGDSLLSALTRLQSIAEPGRASSESATQDSSAAAREHGSHLDQIIVETVALVFDYVYRDERISAAVKAQLLRLQVVAIKAALIDRSFFARRQHPMRRLIDRIAEIGSDPDFETGADSQLVTDITGVIGWVLETFDRDFATFEQGLEKVEAFTAAEQKRRTDRLSKIAAAAERTEALEVTRDEVRDELLARLPADCPEFVVRFIDRHWTEVIARAKVGAKGAPFDADHARRAADALIWSVLPKHARDVPKLAAALPKMINDMSRGLQFVATSDAERELFFSELLAWHSAAIDAAKRAAAAGEAQPVPGASPDAPPAPIAGAAVTEMEDPDAVDEPPEAQAGDAAEYEDEKAEDTTPVAILKNGDEVLVKSGRRRVKRFKLGWISPGRGVFIFSRYPKDHWTVRREALIDLFDRGMARLVEHQPVLDAAIEKLANSDRPVEAAAAN